MSEAIRKGRIFQAHEKTSVGSKHLNNAYNYFLYLLVVLCNVGLAGLEPAIWTQRKNKQITPMELAL